MKKTIKIMLTLAFVIAALCVTASAATNGFYDIGSVDNVAIAAYAGDTAVTAKDANVDTTDDAAESYYEGADRLEVTYSAATAGEDYGVILVEGTSLPTASSAIYYINQDEAASENVAFNVYPKTIEATKAMTLYISSSATDADLVSVPVSYVVGYEEVIEPEEPEVIYGDVNGNGVADGRDLLRLAKWVIDPDNNEINEANSDVNASGSVDGRDLLRLAKWVVDPDNNVLGPKS